MSDIKKVILIGAGDHGRGTLAILKACNRERTQFEIVGFLDDDASVRGRSIDGVPILGGLDWVTKHGSVEAHFILALASCRAKRALAQRLQGVAFIIARHPSAIVGSDTIVGDGAILAAGVVVAYNTRIGQHVTVNLNATIGHDCEVGDFSTVAPGANLAGRVTTGEGCDISLNATVVRGLTIGSWSTLGPGSVALKDIPPGELWIGNPARTIPASSAVARPTQPVASGVRR